MANGLSNFWNITAVRIWIANEIGENHAILVDYFYFDFFI